MWIIYVPAPFMCIILGVALYGAIREIKHLKQVRTMLLGEIKYLKTELTFHLDVRSSMLLNLAERQMILGALKTPEYKDRVTAPATKHLIRAVYHGLVEKVKGGIKEGLG